MRGLRGFFGVCLVALAGSFVGEVHAADLPRSVLAPLPVFTWAGLYAGAHAAAAFGNENGYELNTVTGQATNFGRNGVAPMGGVQVGYNSQHDRFVLGVEADVTAGSFSAGNGTIRNQAGTLISKSQDDVDLLASFRTRAGVAIDRVLLYGTAGLALRTGDASRTQYLTSTPAAPLSSGPVFTERYGATKIGFTAGLGIEYAFAEHWSFKAEYDYYRFGRLDSYYPKALASVATPHGAAERHEVFSQNSNLVKIGVNYNFDCCQAPVGTSQYGILSNWMVGGYVGQLYKQAFVSLFSAPQDLRFSPSYIAELNATYKVYRFENLPLQFDLDFDAGMRFGQSHEFDVGFVPMLRWMYFPWNSIVYTNLRLGLAGVSYTSDVSAWERFNSGNHTGSRFLHFLVPELTFSPGPDAGWEAFVRVHHRSGVFGLVNDDSGGSNYLSVGYRVGL